MQCCQKLNDPPLDSGADKKPEADPGENRRQTNSAEMIYTSFFFVSSHSFSLSYDILILFLALLIIAYLAWILQLLLFLFHCIVIFSVFLFQIS